LQFVTFPAAPMSAFVSAIGGLAAAPALWSARLDIIRKMRVVLETYCRTTYLASFAAEDWLGDIVG